MTIEELLQITIDRNASDLHLQTGSPPCLRVDGELVFLNEKEVLTAETSQELIYSILTADQKDLLQNNREIDFSLDLTGSGRFRANVYFQKDSLAAAFRCIPSRAKTIDELALPAICHQIAKLKQGFILITGPTGEGKSTTIAAILDEIVKTRSAKIITIEDPIEYIFQSNLSLISQRELHRDTHSWSAALRSALREDPDVVLVGEMRDYDTISAALTIAETGHLVFSTLHTNSASQTVDRIIDAFPEEAKNQVKIQLASALEVVISQRLLPKIGGGRVVAYEIMVASPAIKTTIREGKTHQIDNMIQTSGFLGMSTMENCLADLVKKGMILPETARMYSLHPEEVSRLLKSE